MRLAEQLELPAEAQAAAEEVRAWLVEHPSPDPRHLADAGLVAPHWPRPWGRDATPIEQLAIDSVLREARVQRPVNVIGLGWAGPTLLHAGTADQHERWLPGILDGSEVWCQLFSEPDAGSDLASLTTRAVRDGDEWVVQGRKIWTSMGHLARWGILLARTGHAGVDAHGAITYFVCDMQAPGVSVRPIRDMTGTAPFNEVVLDEVRIPDSQVVGPVGGGWELAKVTLANERVSLSRGGALWGFGPTADDLVDTVRPLADRLRAQDRARLVEVWSEGAVLAMLRLRGVAVAVAGRPPGPESSVAKLLADQHGQRLFQLARDLAGAAGMLADVGPLGTPQELWGHGFLFSPALTIGGGTAQVQRNVIGERVLGLPRDPPAPSS